MKTPLRIALFLAIAVLAAATALAQDASPAPAPAPTSAPITDRIGLWPLFVQSLDVFTVLLLAGSITAAWLITLRAMDLRSSVVLPESSVHRIDTLLRAGRLGELEMFCEKDDTIPARALHAAFREKDAGPEAMLDAAEMAASAETARLYRSIDLLNVIGNLGPLVGLAGTVWGMILAFTSLGATEGQAGPADLSLGISKALFHTLLGLLLAIPCLLSYAIFRNMVDRSATRGMGAASRFVERLTQTLPGVGTGPRAMMPTPGLTTGLTTGPTPGPSIPAIQPPRAPQQDAGPQGPDA